MSKVILKEGEKIFVKGSGKNPYEVKMSGGVISCTCPAWKNQSKALDQRTCKHIIANVGNSVFVMPDVSDAPVVIPPKTPKNVPPCLLAHSWDGEQDVRNWIHSPKLDGVRAWWDGEKFWSRLGNEYHAPQWFKDAMPKGVVLDGELFAGNGNFSETVSTVKKFIPNDDEWKKIQFWVFDLPKHGGIYEDRMTELVKILPTHVTGCTDLCVRVPTGHIASGYSTFDLLKDFEKAGYEGVMLRQPGSLYEEGRSNTLLKVKSFKDCEVEVLDYIPGKGKHKGRMGALHVKMDSGVEFDVGTGFKDQERENPPAVGSRVTIKYQELSKDFVPRFPVYVSNRNYE
jgi:DNA ligase-1